MNKVLLIHQDTIQHYRVPVYNYLHTYLLKNGFKLTIVSEGIQEGGDCIPEFPMKTIHLSFRNTRELTSDEKPAAVILFVNHRKSFLFPYLFYLRCKGRKAITWTHGMDLQSRHSIISRLLHHLEHALCHGIILYAEHLRPQLAKQHQQKAFVANNTLNLSRYDTHHTDRTATLAKYGITTKKNIICVGRIQRRKRIDDLFKAFEFINNEEIGIVLVGPDDEGLAASLAVEKKNVFIPGPLYGEAEIDLLRSCDVYCIPGAIGLSIVDAQYCGLPVVTEDVEHGPEIMYLKDGRNGFIVPQGDFEALAERLQLLINDDDLRKHVSEEAREENATNANIDMLCKGFVACLQHLIP